MLLTYFYPYKQNLTDNLCSQLCLYDLRKIDKNNLLPVPFLSLADDDETEKTAMKATRYRRPHMTRTLYRLTMLQPSDPFKPPDPPPPKIYCDRKRPLTRTHSNFADKILQTWVNKSPVTIMETDSCTLMNSTEKLWPTHGTGHS